MAEVKDCAANSKWVRDGLISRKDCTDLILQLLELEPITTHIGIVMMLSNNRAMNVLDKVGLLGEIGYTPQESLEMMKWPEALEKAVENKDE